MTYPVNNKASGGKVLRDPMAEELLRVIKNVRTEHPTQVPAGLLPIGSGAEEGRENAEQSRVLGHCCAADV